MKTTLYGFGKDRFEYISEGEAVGAYLAMIMNTPKGSRYNDPNFGSDLHTFSYMPMTQSFAYFLDAEIRSALAILGGLVINSIVMFNNTKTICLEIGVTYDGRSFKVLSAYSDGRFS